MLVLWITLLVLHRGYSLVPVVTVQLGEPATIICVLHNRIGSSGELYWYKQSAGDNMKLIVILWESRPQFAPGFSDSKLKVNSSKSSSNLTILRTTEEDEGLYHCADREGLKSEWRAKYLLVKGNSERTSTVVQTVSNPVRPGDSVTLQCSVLSDSDNKTCPGDHSVYWFRPGSDKSHPEIIYTGGNNECEKRSDSVKSCVYRFSKNVSSSDAGTYYCAVATCGQILFGDGTNLQIEGTSIPQAKTIIFLLCVVLVISLIAIVILIRTIKSDRNAAAALKSNSVNQNPQQVKYLSIGITL
ncbi:signal-regulatory protein beta-2-like [Anabas testudineus]|uniref:signal-regulatory protein beta-2-like n=1 Tax=Anabas testudineus TaxID=64144 RepID=UPI000E457EA2|nr:signal-regulatory protein beta-2-like [Anabas testudineus]